MTKRSPEADPLCHPLDVAIVGAGQAGLAVGKYLQDFRADFALFDRAARVGDSWRNRYDSLRLFSPRSMNALPGLPMDGCGDGYPDKDEVADYLESYAHRYQLPLNLGSRVRILKREDGHFLLGFDSGEVVWARSVVICSGAFQEPLVPSFAGQLAPDLLQLTAATYRNPEELPDGPVLVAGGGATGRQIALELIRTRATSLSRGSDVSISPQRILGRDVMRWAWDLGLLQAGKTSVRGRLARRFDSFPGLHLKDRSLARAGVSLLGRCISGQAASLQFACGQESSFEAVIWAMGYRDDTSWLQVEGALSAGQILADRGVSPVPGLFYSGRSWQTCRASGLMCGTGIDAGSIALKVRQYLSEI